MELSPTQSSSLARDVYALTKYPKLKDAYGFLNQRYNNAFQFDEKNMIKGKTGGPGPVKCRTAFGFTLIGQGNQKGKAFLLFRGTQYLADWLTNLNALTSRSCYHELVHDGFNTAFESMRNQLLDFVVAAKKSGVTQFHCIGHSLGGALATLCAEWLKAEQSISPYLYTYGSPRVGFKGFAENCTKKVGEGRIFRAYHKTDIVPCIPVWPYFHTPYKSTEYYLPSPGVVPGAAYHSMEKYCDSVENSSWKVLSGLKAEQKSDASIIAWLKSEGPVGLTIRAIEFLGHAIQFVIRKCINAVKGAVEFACSASSTILDRIAIILSNGVNLEENISSWVIYLMRKIMKFLGYAKELSKSEISRDSIRTIFLQLQQKMNTIAQTALNKALVDGRAL